MHLSSRTCHRQEESEQRALPIETAYFNIMKCTVLGRHIRLLAKAIHALAKVGEDLYLDPVPDGLGFITLNSSRSAVMTYKFHRDFFEFYEEKSPADISMINAKDPVSNILIESILSSAKYTFVKMKSICHSPDYELSKSFKVSRDDAVLSDGFQVSECFGEDR